MLLKEEINKYLNYCKFQKELNDKTIKAYKADGAVGCFRKCLSHIRSGGIFTRVYTADS